MRKKDQPKLWLCLYLPNLALEVFYPSGPKQPPNDGLKPIAIIQQQRIEALSYHAAATGLRVGTMASHAYALCENLTCIEKSAAKERRALVQIAQWLYEFTPNVCPYGDQHLILEVSSSLKLFSGLNHLKYLIEEKTTHLGYTPKLGVSQTPLAAKISAEIDCPDNHQQSPGIALKSLQLIHLQLPPPSVMKLEKMGITILKQLIDLPRHTLKKRFGDAFIHYLERLLGERADPQTFIKPAPKFESDIFFMNTVDNLQSLIFPINRLLNELSAFLTVRQLQLQHFNLRLNYRGQLKKDLSIHLAAPDNDADLFLKLSEIKLNQVQGVQTVDELSLRAAAFYPAKLKSNQLFGSATLPDTAGMDQKGQANQAALDPETLKQGNDLLNLLQHQLETTDCFGLRLGNDHRPEKDWARTDLTQHFEQKVTNPLPNWPERPTFLIEPPKRLQKHLNPLQHPDFDYIKGPERINSAWWDGDGQNRDYYLYRYRKQVVYWIFYRALTHRWYLHGLFS